MRCTSSTAADAARMMECTLLANMLNKPMLEGAKQQAPGQSHLHKRLIG